MKPPNGRSRLGSLLALHENRVRHDKDFQYLLDDISQAQQLRKSNVISLNEADRRKEREMKKKRLADREGDAGKGAVHAVDNAHQDDGLQAGERNLAKELAAEKTRKSAKDVLLVEAVNILGDEVAMKKNKPKLPSYAKTGGD